MKKLICCMLALLMVMSVMSAAAFAAGEDTLVIYSARNERLNNIVIPAFDAKTGIKVAMITGSSFPHGPIRPNSFFRFIPCGVRRKRAKDGAFHRDTALEGLGVMCKVEKPQRKCA